MVLSKVRQVLTSLSQLETSENTTFIIQNTVRAAAGVSKISIASEVSLVFEGGMIAGALVTLNNKQIEQPLKLVGNFTSVEAPITQIFGDTVSAKGYWHIDRAYPQWFDAVVGTQSYDTANPHDCSVAINKAVEMKMSGEVFLPAGVCLVSHTIFLRHGINLIGDSATRTKIDQDNMPDPEMVDGWGRATFITPFFENGKDGFVVNELNGAGGAAIVAVNIKQPEIPILTKVAAGGGLTPAPVDQEKPVADVNYAHPFGSIEQIYFYNPNHRTKTSGAKDCADILWMPVPIEKIGDKDITDADLDMNKIPEFITQPNSGIEAIQFIADNVSCIASATPAAGEWKSGDTIVIKPSVSGYEQEWRDATIRIKN